MYIYTCIYTCICIDMYICVYIYVHCVNTHQWKHAKPKEYFWFPIQAIWFIYGGCETMLAIASDASKQTSHVPCVSDALWCMPTCARLPRRLLTSGVFLPPATAYNLSACPLVHLSVCPFVRLSVCLLGHLSVWTLVHFSVCALVCFFVRVSGGPEPSERQILKQFSFLGVELNRNI